VAGSLRGPRKIGGTTDILGSAGATTDCCWVRAIERTDAINRSEVMATILPERSGMLPDLTPRNLQSEDFAGMPIPSLSAFAGHSTSFKYLF